MRFSHSRTSCKITNLACLLWGTYSLNSSEFASARAFFRRISWFGWGLRQISRCFQWGPWFTCWCLGCYFRNSVCFGSRMALSLGSIHLSCLYRLRQLALYPWSLKSHFWAIYQVYLIQLLIEWKILLKFFGKTTPPRFHKFRQSCHRLSLAGLCWNHDPFFASCFKVVCSGL